MEKGNSYIITYHNMDEKTALATFLEAINGIYLFKDIRGEFAITEKKLWNNEITLTLVED